MSLTKLLNFLAELDNRKIHYELKCVRHEAVMVNVCVPGQRWEVEFMDDGTIEIEKFKSDGEMSDEKELEVLFRDFSD